MKPCCSRYTRHPHLPRLPCHFSNQLWWPPLSSLAASAASPMKNLFSTAWAKHFRVYVLFSHALSFGPQRKARYYNHCGHFSRWGNWGSETHEAYAPRYLKPRPHDLPSPSAGGKLKRHTWATGVISTWWPSETTCLSFCTDGHGKLSSPLQGWGCTGTCGRLDAGGCCEEQNQDPRSSWGQGSRTWLLQQKRRPM
jgi:hypothetical protein